MSGRRIVFCLVLLASFVLAGEARAQTPQEIAAAAGQAMQQGDYAAAEKHYGALVERFPQAAELHSNLGLARFFNRDYAGAEKAFRAALARDSALFVPNFFLGRLLFEKSRYGEALPLLKAAVHAQPEQEDARRTLAAVLVGMERYEEAIQEYRRMLEKDPEDVETLYQLGKVYLELGQRTYDRLGDAPDSPFYLLANAELQSRWPGFEDVAEDFYRRAAKAAPSHAGVQTNLGRFLLEQGETAEAAEALDRAIEAGPAAYEALFLRAFARLQEKQTKAAAADLRRAAEIRPEFFRPLPPAPVEVALNSSQAEDLERAGGFAAAYLLAVSGRGERWRAAAEEALSAMPPPAAKGGGQAMVEAKRYEQGAEKLLPKARELSGAARLALLRALFETGRYEKLTSLAREEDLKNPEAVYLLGAAYKQLGQSLLERLAAAAPDSARAHQLLGDSFAAREQYDEAIAEYEKAARKRPNDPEILFSMGKAWYNKPDHPRAEQAYRRVLELNPLHAEAAYNLGLSLVSQSRHQQALAAFRQALELKPGWPRAHASLGRALAALGEDREAVKHLERGAAADSDGTVHYQLFQLYRKLGESAKAEAALNHSKALRRAARESANRPLSGAPSP